MTEAIQELMGTPPRRMPQQKPGKSKQDYQTPPALLDAIKVKLGIRHFSIDLAASAENKVTERFYSEADDALIRPWDLFDGWNYCNPPFADLSPWVAKAELESKKGAKTAMLVPASVGSNWWASFVHNRAHTLFLHGRVTFVGASAPYPKDCAVLLYSHSHLGGYSCWDWQAETDL